MVFRSAGNHPENRKIGLEAALGDMDDVLDEVLLRLTAITFIEPIDHNNDPQIDLRANGREGFKEEPF